MSPYADGTFPKWEVPENWCRRNKKGVLICPECFEHEQGDSMKVNDCKTTIWRKNDKGQWECIGQCCCYSEAHGRRKR